MTVGRVSLGRGALVAQGGEQSTAKTVLGGAAVSKVLPWILGAVVVVVVVIVIGSMKKD